MSENSIVDIIKEWAKDKKDEIEFVEENFFKNVIPYRTTKMTKLIPDDPEIKEKRNKKFDLPYWRNPYFYAYEIVCQRTQLKLQFVFNYNSISESTKRICEKIYNSYRMHHIKDNLDQSYRNVCIYEIDIKECDDKEHIKRKMDQLFYQMTGYEEFICYKLQEGKA